MPRAMRLLTGLLVAAVLAAALPASAQPPTFDHAYQVRGAFGDIPTTQAAEPAGAWNMEQRLAVRFENHSEARYVLHVPAGAEVVNATCTPCSTTQAEPSADAVTFILAASEPSGAYTLTLATRQAAGLAFGFSVDAPSGVAEDDRVAILYVPTGYAHSAPFEGTSPGLSTDGSARIVVFEGFHDPLWVAIHAGEAASAGGADGDGALSGWLLPAVAGLLLGIVLWALLVSRGVVQAKSRRQVAATAAHVEAAQADPPAVLEGKKRALMAALKDIEVAKMNSEMPPEVYDAVKADLKRQAVTVMRALESSQAASDAKA